MTEFEMLQGDIETALADREASGRNAFNSAERLSRLRRQQEGALRSVGRNSDAFRALVDRERQIADTVAADKARFARDRAAVDDLWDRFEPFTDPREQLKNLSDEYPILLFPVRLEIRFKRIPQPRGGTQHQLWVRVFPDDVSIETFDETLTEAETQRAKDYWTTVFKAGTAGDPGLESFVENRRRGAWRDLMGTFNAGRAHWIEQQYRPINEAELPVRSAVSDTILVIRTEEPPSEATRNALGTYWSAVWSAGGEATATAAALATLAGALAISEGDALGLVTDYAPHNVADELTTADPANAVQVAWLIFPAADDVDTKLAAWSSPTRVTTLPERFVLLGFRDGDPEPVLQALGNRIPDSLVVGPPPETDIDDVLLSEFGPGFADLAEDEKAEKYVEYLSQRSDTKWLFDFETAVDVGMALKVDLTTVDYRAGFDRLFVLGIRLSASEETGKAALERLIKSHHLGESGFSLVPQGAPTNNTEDSRSNYSVVEDADQAYDRYFAAVPGDDPSYNAQKRDGRWLAELLGIDAQSATLDLVEGYYGTDQCEARAMNTALWNATLGYFFESMLTPVFTDEQRDVIRWFFIHHVSGRGRLPAVRVGDQPYGILPVTTVSDMKWLSTPRVVRTGEFELVRGLGQIYSTLRKLRTEWDRQLDQVAHVGHEKSGDDAHKIVLKALGLHATSVTFDQRYVRGFGHLYNLFQALGLPAERWIEIIEENYRQTGLDLLRELDYVHDAKLDPEVPILDKVFNGASYRVTRPLVDDPEFSETAPVRAYTPEGWNYIRWLVENARNNHANIKGQKGFTERPTALLYDMLRHSVNLEFGNTGLKLYRNANVITSAQASAARVDAEFIGIQEIANRLESKWDLIYRRDDRIASDGALVVDHISTLLRTAVVNSQMSHLQEMIEALTHLENVPTARLERVFVEHIDCCTYRLDAWLLGLIDFQLQMIRANGREDAGGTKSGIYLGAYGWLENVRPDERALEPADIPDDLKSVFDPDDDKEITIDDTNAGYVHAPSIQHGLTAAVLRNAYISNASPQESEPFKVNLSSERVRLALSMIEGIQQGQSLGALLGYQLERGLHDNTDLELDSFIYELREEFSLASNRLLRTKIREGRVGDTPEESQRIQEEEEEFEAEQAVTKVEARNVVDGLALVDRVRMTGNANYPFGFPTGTGVGKLKAASDAEAAAIDAEVQRLLNIRDAIADLAMAEGVHQVVQGNYERAAGALDSYSKGSHPQKPDVVQSPGSGVSLTHRVGIHLPAGVAPAATDTARAKAEPAVNEWLEDLLPNDLSTVACLVEYRLPDYEDTGPAPSTTKPVSMAELGLMPIDLLYMMSGEADKNLTALDDQVLRFVHTDNGPDAIPRPDAELEIRYTHTFDPADNKISFFELASLVQSARTLITATRPLAPTDIGLPNETEQTEDASLTFPAARVVDAKAAVDAIVGDLETDVVSALDPLIDDEDFEVTMGNAAAIVAQLDARISDFVAHMHGLSMFGFVEAGFGWAFDRVRTLHGHVYRKVADYKKRWEAKQAEYDDLINTQLPAATTNEERFEILLKAERTVSTQDTVPTPAAVADYLAGVTAKKALFDAAFATFPVFLSGSSSTLSGLLAAAQALTPGLGDFDHEVLDFADDERQMVVLAEDLLNQASKTVAALQDKSGAVQDLIDQEAASTEAKEKVELLSQAAKLLFGEDFTVLPEFGLSDARAAELQRCLDDKPQLLDHQIKVESSDFPVDDWLYGVARVREKVGVWENLVILAEGLKERPALDLTPLQLPYTENDHWLGLAYPEGFEISGDKLLYTAYVPAFDPTEPQCGLLIDEWTEVIPARQETTGVTFHYDRPNSEPPQAMLLVTPGAFTGAWRWSDVVETLNETLDMAQLRAIEPDHVDRTRYARFLAATVAPATVYPVTMVLNYLLTATAIEQQP